MRSLFKSIAAGMMIALGCTTYLTIENKFLGAGLFALGLYTVILFELNLFTGKIGYFRCYCSSLKNFFMGIKDMFMIWFGNLIGIFLTTQAVNLTRLNIHTDLMINKAADSPLSLLILGIFCGIMMYIAVEGYKCCKNPFIVIMPVMVFILCGFEHCIADMAYLFYSNNVANLQFWLAIIIITFGNSIGGILMNFFRNQYNLKLKR